MTERILVDTGPLVAILRKNDQHHHICVEQLRALQGPLRICAPVLTEAVYLLRQDPRAVKTLVAHWFSAGVLEFVPLDTHAPAWITAFFERYDNLTPEFADAALVYLAEREGMNTIFTLDRRHFLTYRTSDNKALQLIPTF